MTPFEILQKIDDDGLISVLDLNANDYDSIKQLLDKDVIQEIYNTSTGGLHVTAYKRSSKKVIQHPDLDWIKKFNEENLK